MTGGKSWTKKAFPERRISSTWADIIGSSRFVREPRHEDEGIDARR